MATNTVSPTTGEASIPAPAVANGERPYDRSSLRGDYMVMIAGQTVEQWRRLAPDNQICEYIDGIIYMPNAPADEHQDVAGFLFYLFQAWRYTRDTGPVRFAPWALTLRADRNPQPDISVLPAEGSQGVPALLVIEILSPSTRAHDLGVKLDLYRDAAIPEIAFIDLDERSVRVERLGAEGRYGTERLTAGCWSVAALPGFWIDVSWLWARPLPNPLRCLETILGRPPAPPA